MDLKGFLVVCALLVAALSYWAYAPLPPGYSALSRAKFQLAMINMKSKDALSSIGSSLGFGLKAQINRRIDAFFMKDLPTTEGVVSDEAFFDGIRVRIYKPSDILNETLAGIMYYHGGGWTYGSIEKVDSIVTRLCEATRTVVVSVDYRMAPEFPFPAAIDDCTTATKYFLKNAAEFNVDPTRIAVTGDSAGGNLAAAVSLRLRDENFPIRIKLQVLIYPITQGLDFNLPSYVQHRNGPLLTRAMMTFFTTMYIDGNHDHEEAYWHNRHVTKSFRKSIAKTYMNLEKLPKEFLSGYVKLDFPDGDEKLWNKIKGKMLNPYYSPLTADNLENLPDTYVFTANYDPLRDEGWLYAIKLKEANNRVTIYNAENGFHGMINFVGGIPETDSEFAEITKFIADNI